MVYLVEDFFSIQGEGRHIGVPSIFLRFGGCNLRCPGFGRYELEGETVLGCDTLRAVDRRRYGRGWQKIERATDLIMRVQNRLEGLAYRPHVVLTGGEPMLFWNDPAFYGLVGWLVREGFEVTVETNATIAPDFDRYRYYEGVTFAMAVKLSNSGEPQHKRVVPAAITALASRGKGSFFKFTIDPTLQDCHRQIREIVDGFANEVYCMPLGDNRETLAQNAPWTADFCLKHGFRYSDRLQVRLYNREEGR